MGVVREVWVLISYQLLVYQLSVISYQFISASAVTGADPEQPLAQSPLVEKLYKVYRKTNQMMYYVNLP